MKKSMTLFCSVLLLSSFLAACNTDSTEPATTAANEAPQVETEVNIEAPENDDDSTTTDTTNTAGTTEATKQPVAQTETPKKQNVVQADSTLTYISNQKQLTEDTVTSTSDEMDYSIQHFDDYALTSEEPGIDRLLYKDDDLFSMQIKLSTTEETTFDNIKAGVIETITVIAPEGKYEELDVSAIQESHKDIKNIAGYETLLESEKVIIVTYEKGNHLVTLTIYDTVEADLEDAFLQMGLTIQ